MRFYRPEDDPDWYTEKLISQVHYLDTFRGSSPKYNTTLGFLYPMYSGEAGFPPNKRMAGKIVLYLDTGNSARMNYKLVGDPNLRCALREACAYRIYRSFLYGRIPCKGDLQTGQNISVLPLCADIDCMIIGKGVSENSGRCPVGDYAKLYLGYSVTQLHTDDNGDRYR